MTNKEIYKRIYDKLPYKWEQVTVNQYNRLQEIKPVSEDSSDTDKMDNNIKIIAALTGELEADIRSLEAKYVMVLVDKIKFTIEPVNASGKSKLKCKSVDKLTWDEWIRINQALEKPSYNFIPVLSAVLEDKKVDIGELSIVDALDGFFLLQRRYKRLLQRSLLSTSLKLMYLMVKEKIQVVLSYNKIEHKQ